MFCRPSSSSFRVNTTPPHPITFQGLGRCPFKIQVSLSAPHHNTSDTCLPACFQRLSPPPAAFLLVKTGSGSSHRLSSHWSNLGQSPTCPMADAHDRRSCGGGGAMFANLTLSGGWLVEKGSRSPAHFLCLVPPPLWQKEGRIRK